MATTIAPIDIRGVEGAETGRLNNTLYAGSVAFPTIQSAVNYASPLSGNFDVLISAMYTGNETISAITGGRSGLYIIDERGGPRVPYIWYKGQYTQEAITLPGIATSQIDTIIYVDQTSPKYPTIQSAVTFTTSIPTVNFMIVILPGYAGSESISAITGGGTNAYIVDERTDIWQIYTWSGSQFVPADFIQAGNIHGQRIRAFGWEAIDLTRSNVGIGVSNTGNLPIITMVNYAAPLDQKVWSMYGATDHLQFNADADSGTNYPWLEVFRAGTTVTSIQANYPLTLSGDPTAPLQAATKQYVDDIAIGGQVFPQPGIGISTGTAWAATSAPATTDASGNLTITSNVTAPNFKVALQADGKTNGTLNFGLGFAGPAIILFDGDTATLNKYGWGLLAGEMQFFIGRAPVGHFSWNASGQLDAAEAHQLMTLDGATGNLWTLGNVTAGGTGTFTQYLYLTDAGKTVALFAGSDGNLHINPPSGAGILFNWDSGSGVAFGNGSGGTVASIDNTGGGLFHGHVESIGGTTTDMSQSNIAISSGNGYPTIQWINTSSAADAKYWDVVCETDGLHFRLGNDALNTTNDWLLVTRNGVTPSGANFGCTVTMPNNIHVGDRGSLNLSAYPSINCDGNNLFLSSHNGNLYLGWDAGQTATVFGNGAGGTAAAIYSSGNADLYGTLTSHAGVVETLTYQMPQNTDLNTYLVGGFWVLVTDGSVDCHAPVSGAHYWGGWSVVFNSNWVAQTCIFMDDWGNTNHGLYTRKMVNGTWEAWYWMAAS